VGFKCFLLSWLCLRDRCMSKFIWTLRRGVNSIRIRIWTEFRSELIWAAFISVNWIKMMIWTDFWGELMWASFIGVNWTRSRSGFSLHLHRGTGWYLYFSFCTIPLGVVAYRFVLRFFWMSWDRVQVISEGSGASS
jgi:hypothetical protein